MYSLVGRLIEPLAHLQIGVVQTHKLPQRHEVLFHITHTRPLDLSLLPGRGDVTGSRVKSILARESEEPLVELHDIAFVFTYRRRQIVVRNFTTEAAKEAKPMLMTTDEAFEILAVCELNK